MKTVSASPSNNKVTVGTKTTSYYKTFGGKKYSFVGSHSRKTDAKSMASQRKKMTPYNYHRIVPFNGMYLLYTAK